MGRAQQAPLTAEEEETSRHEALVQQYLDTQSEQSEQANQQEHREQVRQHLDAEAQAQPAAEPVAAAQQGAAGSAPAGSAAVDSAGTAQRPHGPAPAKMREGVCRQLTKADRVCLSS